MLLSTIWSAPLLGQNATDAQIEHLQWQLQQQAAELAELRSRLDQREGVFTPTFVADPASCGNSSLQRLPLVADVPSPFTCADSPAPESFYRLNYYADYDHGFVIRPFDAEKFPFEMKFNGWGQFRYHAFSRGVTSWTDNAGITRPVRNRDAFDIERARLMFSGHFIAPQLGYLVLLDGDTDGAHAVDFFYYYLSWKFSDSFELQLGKRKVPGTRQWLMSSRRTRLDDRPMSLDFFRPNLTVGLFGVGKWGETGHYEAMVGNGYFSSNAPNSSSDNELTFAFNNYVDPWGKFGEQIADYEYSEQPLVRLGHSMVYSPQQGIVDGVPLDEADFIRLSDGTRLTETGALAPGVTVNSFNVYLYGMDAAWKYRGWSVDAEVFLRWIQQIEANGPLPRHQLFQHGFYVEGGKFLIPGVLDINARYSQVAGDYGTGREYGAGMNWYPLKTSRVKISLDAVKLENSPLQNTSSDIMVGDTGTLIRSQFQAEF
ncbi:porin [Bremerella cremea]|nr:porin [Bremerella cremea]